ncbi:MAG: Serine-type D-Ala-D-Ala carboxypeptidase [Firmicutes bacterium]|nr:Serine-type D-Ala-D-Ala carboxypeptidase [Bacillota bacterium]
MSKKIIALFICSTLSVTATALASPNPLNLTAKSAIVIEASTGEILYEKNAEERRYPASTTKMMTIITALESGKVNDIVTVSPNAANTEGSSMDVTVGERLKMQDMLYGVALVSGNDATVAIAEHISGSVSNFAKLMTNKAHGIGALSTNFTNSSGLPDPNHYSTAHDLARIAAYGYKNPNFAEIVGTLRKDIPRNNNQKETFYNENKLLRIYNGANGVKTGYTDDAGRCLVSAAKRGNIQLITAVLDDDNMWEDSIVLLDYGFSQLQETEMVHAGDLVTTMQVTNGKTDVTPAVIRDSLFVPVTQSNYDEFRTVVEISKTVSAPVVAGQKVGVVKVMYHNKEVASTDVVVTESVNRNSFFVKIKNFFANLFH